MKRVCISQMVLIFSIPLAFVGCGKEASLNDDKNSGTAPPPLQGENQFLETASNVQMFEPKDGVLSKKESLRARILSWEKGPHVTLNDELRNSFTVEIADSQGMWPRSKDLKPEFFAVLEVFPYMKIHGHGVPKSMLPSWNLDGNLVKISNLGFVMAGPWEIKVKFKFGNVEDELEIPVQVP